MAGSHFKMYKPAGVLSQFVSQQKKAHKKRFLGSFYPFPKGTMSIGRLDEKSEGLLLLTTEGLVSNAINKGPYEKEYWVQVAGEITTDAIDRLKQGVAISLPKGSYRTKPCEVVSLDVPDLPEPQYRLPHPRHGPTSWIAITLTEGKFRQIRKMTAAVGFPTLRLVRVRVGTHTIESLQPGDVRPVDTLP